jgi:hypothetical protein
MQYASSGETTQLWSSVRIGDNGNIREYCLFEFSNLQSTSKTIVLDSNDQRVSNQTCFFWIFCQSNSDLQAVEFSYLTTNNVENNFQNIQRNVDDMAIELVNNSQIYSSSLTPILDGVKFVIDNVGIVPIRIGIFSIDITPALRQLAYQQLDIISPPNWHTIVSRFNQLRGDIDNLNLRSKSGFISFDYQIKPFYADLSAVQQFITIVDNKTNSNLNNKFGSLNFYQMGITFSLESLQEMNNIEQRVSMRKQDAINSNTNAIFQLNAFSNEIGSAVNKQIDLTNFKNEYCTLKKSSPADSLLTGENFQDYIDANNKIASNAVNATAQLSQLETQSANISFGFIYSIIWNLPFDLGKGC